MTCHKYSFWITSAWFSWSIYWSIFCLLNVSLNWTSCALLNFWSHSWFYFVNIVLTPMGLGARMNLSCDSSVNFHFCRLCNPVFCLKCSRVHMRQSQKATLCGTSWLFLQQLFIHGTQIPPTFMNHHILRTWPWLHLVHMGWRMLIVY